MASISIIRKKIMKCKLMVLLLMAFLSSQSASAEPDLPACMRTQDYFNNLSDRIRLGLSKAQSNHIYQLKGRHDHLADAQASELKIFSWLRYLERISIILPARCGAKCRGSLMVIRRGKPELFSIMAGDAGAGILNIRLIDDAGTPFGVYGYPDPAAVARARGHQIVIIVARPDGVTAYKIEHDVMTNEFNNLQILSADSQLSEQSKTSTKESAEQEYFRKGRLKLSIIKTNSEQVARVRGRPCPPFE